jgi:hypothetical protein
MRRRIVVLAATVAALAVLAPAAAASSSHASPLTTYVYTCSNGRKAKLVVTGNAAIFGNPLRIHLTAVRFKLINPFGPIIVNAATFTVPDPNNVSAPYFAGAATGAAPPGWTGAHAAGALDANFTGALAVPAGGVFMSALLRGKYSDLGPVGTVISFRPGAFSLSLAPPNGAVTCHPLPGPPAFVSVTE